jgi:hypothetical protein
LPFCTATFSHPLSFLLHSTDSQYCALAMWQSDDDGKGDADFFSHTHFCFLALNSFTWYHAW